MPQGWVSSGLRVNPGMWGSKWFRSYLNTACSNSGQTITKMILSEWRIVVESVIGYFTTTCEARCLRRPTLRMVSKSLMTQRI